MNEGSREAKIFLYIVTENAAKGLVVYCGRAEECALVSLAGLSG